MIYFYFALSLMLYKQNKGGGRLIWSFTPYKLSRKEMHLS